MAKAIEVHNVPFVAQNGPSKMCHFWHMNIPGRKGKVELKGPRYFNTRISYPAPSLQSPNIILIATRSPTTPSLETIIIALFHA